VAPTRGASTVTTVLLAALLLGVAIAGSAPASGVEEKPAAKAAPAKKPEKARPKTVDKEIEKQLQQAGQARDKKDQWAAALETCERIASDDTIEAAYRVAAFDIRIDILRRQEKFEDAVAESAKMRQALPDDKVLQQRAYFNEADLLRLAKKDALAIEKYREFIKAPGTEKPAAAEAQLKIADVFMSIQKWADGLAEAAKVAQIDPENDRAVGSALWIQQDAAVRMEKIEDAVALLRKFLDPKYLAKRETYNQRDARGRMGDYLKRLKKLDEVRAHFEACEKVETDPATAQVWCVRTAEACLELGQVDDALRAYERVFVRHPQVTDQWYGVERAVAALLLKQGKLEEALKAARISFDAAYDEGTIADNVRLIAEILKGLDKNVGRANAFIAFQRFGPAGEEGKPGTAVKNPLEGLAAPSYPERDKAFAEARKAAGDDVRSMQFRAATFSYSGHPKEALKCYMDAFARSSGDELQQTGRAMILIGARAVRGHAAGLEEFFTFVNYGPAGPDGKPGTADDLKDPFAPLVN
jgi:tetratricopeptide (TPR) repeat protein